MLACATVVVLAFTVYDVVQTVGFRRTRSGRTWPHHLLTRGDLLLLISHPPWLLLNTIYILSTHRLPILLQRLCPEPFPFYYDINPISLGIFDVTTVIPALLQTTITAAYRQKIVKRIIIYLTYALIWLIMDYFIANGTDDEYFIYYLTLKEEVGSCYVPSRYTCNTCKIMM